MRREDLASRASAGARHHLVFLALLGAGLAFRIITQLAYQPALLYIDSKKYLFGFEIPAWGKLDPLGYSLLLLHPALKVTSLAGVAVLQHALGLAMALLIYLLLLRLRVRPWLAALGSAPVLLDGYQLNAEQTIMPDVLFEALVLSGLVLLLWRPRPRPGAGAGAGLAIIAGAGLLLGLSAPVRQIGEVLIVPAAACTLAAAGRWRTRLLRTAVLTGAFAVPVLGYLTYSATVPHYGFRFSGLAGIYLYGRTAHAADCPALQLPVRVRFLCPTRQAAAALGVDGLVNTGLTRQQRYYPAAPLPAAGSDYNQLFLEFSRAVLTQQPGRVAADVARDSVRLFALTRDGTPGIPPISRWQFHDGYPYYPPGITRTGPTSANTILRLRGGGQVRTITALTRILRGYQLHGGFTPGPAYLACLLAGLAGGVIWFRAGDRHRALACLLLLASGGALLLGADAYEFSWRYQLPALVTFPPAGVLGALALRPLLSPRRLLSSGRLVNRTGDQQPGAGHPHADQQHRVSGPVDQAPQGPDRAEGREPRNLRLRGEG